MAVLTEEQKEFIVIGIACYDTPKQVADAFKDEFGVTIARQQVEEYDPRKKAKLSQKWKDLHDTTRNAFLKDLSTEPATKKSVRVRRLAAMARRAESKNNMVLAASLYEQIAKEMGDAYTNKRIIVPADPLKELASLLDMAPEQLTAALGALEASDVAAAAAVVTATDGSESDTPAKEPKETAATTANAAPAPGASTT